MRDAPNARGWIRVRKSRGGRLYEVTPWVGNSFTAHMWRSVVLHWAGITEAGYPLTLGAGSLFSVTDASLTPVGVPQALRSGYPSYAGDFYAYFLWESQDGQQTGDWDNIYVMTPGGVVMSEFIGVSLGTKGINDTWQVEYEFRID